MKILHFHVGDIGTNCYLVFDEQTMEGAIIDPGDEADKLMYYIESNQIKLKYILLTHAHFDHILAVGEIKRKTDAQVVVCREDEYLFSPQTNLGPFGAYGRQLRNRYDFPGADIWAEEGTTIAFGDQTVKYLHTPGHTPGSCVLMLNDAILFTGDTLFCHECGRTDLPGGSWSDMLKSLKRLHDLPGDYRIMPGHDSMSTLEDERRNNPYMREACRS